MCSARARGDLYVGLLRLSARAGGGMCFLQEQGRGLLMLFRQEQGGLILISSRARGLLLLILSSRARGAADIFRKNKISC
jgi:hypothetical protein